MNIYLRELKAYRRATLFWCLGEIFLIAATMAKYTTMGTAAEFEKLMAQLPPALLAIFSMNMLDIGTAGGFFGVGFLFFALMAAVHAVLLGAGILSKEERDRTSEFLFAKPVTRSQVITAKALAGLTNVAILNLVSLLTSLVVVNKYANGEEVSGYIIVLMSGMLFIQLIFLAAGLLAAAMTDRPKTASGIATGVMLITYVLSAAIDLKEELKPLRFLTPFKYFDVKALYTDMRLEPGYMALSVVLIVTFTAATYYFFRRRDLRI